MVVIPAVVLVLMVNFFGEGLGEEGCCERTQQVATWQTSWSVYPTTSSETAAGWSVQARVPMSAGE